MLGVDSRSPFETPFTNYHPWKLALCQCKSRFLPSPEEIYMRIRTGIQTERRKVASTKQFIKEQYTLKMEWAGLGLATAPRLQDFFHSYW